MGDMKRLVAVVVRVQGAGRKREVTCLGDPWGRAGLRLDCGLTYRTRDTSATD